MQLWTRTKNSSIFSYSWSSARNPLTENSEVAKSFSRNAHKKVICLHLKVVSFLGGEILSAGVVCDQFEWDDIRMINYGKWLSPFCRCTWRRSEMAKQWEKNATNWPRCNCSSQSHCLTAENPSCLTSLLVSHATHRSAESALQIAFLVNRCNSCHASHSSSGTQHKFGNKLN